MALADPQQLTIGANARSLADTGSGPNSTTYTDVDNGLEFIVSHQTTKSGRGRTMIRLNQTKISADPLTAVNKQVSQSAVVTIDTPPGNMFTRVEQKELLLALGTWMAAGSSANLLKVLNGES